MQSPEYRAAAPSSEWSGGWRALAAGFFGMATGWNVANIIASLFLKPMQAELGWSRTELSYGPLASLIVAVLLPVSALLIDRFSARRVAIAGLAMLGTAYFLFSVLPDSKPLYYGVVVFLGVAGAVSNSVVFARGVMPWFERNLGLAVGLMMTGASVAAAVAVPLLAMVIENDGWRAGMRTLGFATWAIGLPLLFVWFREPVRDGVVGSAATVLVRTPFAEIVRRAAFWQVAIASFVAALPIGGFIGHLVPIITDRGISLEVAAGFGSVFAVAIGLGRIVTGFALDRWYPPVVTFFTLALAAIGCTVLAVISGNATWLPIALAVALIGLAQGAEGDYIKFFSMRLFGLADFARVVAIMAMTISAGMALGGLAFAKVFDVSGSYSPAIYASIALYVLGGAVFLTIKMRAAKR